MSIPAFCTLCDSMKYFVGSKFLLQNDCSLHLFKCNVKTAEEEDADLCIPLRCGENSTPDGR